MSLAQILQLTSSQAAAAIGSLRTVIEAGGPVDEREAAFLSTCVDTLELGEAWTAYDPIPPSRASELFPTPDARRALVFALIIGACIDTQATAGAAAAVRSFARELAVETRWVDVLGHASERRVLPVKLVLTRSSPDARRLFARIWNEEGILGILRAIRFVLGGGLVESSLAWRFRQLGLLPEGTLGRAFWASMSERKLAFPGERGGLPIQMIHHDLMHVVNDYPPDAGGECQVAGFYAGFTEGEPFTFMMIVLTTFHLGLPVSPPMVTPTIGAFDPAKVIAAFERGRRLKVDVMGDWDYWALMPLSIPEVRERLGIADPIASTSEPAITV
jgi:hypothetical protein